MCDHGSINFINVNTGKTDKTYTSGSHSIADLMFLQDEDHFLTTDLGKEIKVWNKNNSEIVLNLEDDLSKSLQFDGVNYNKFVQG